MKKLQFTVCFGLMLVLFGLSGSALAQRMDRPGPEAGVFGPGAEGVGQRAKDGLQPLVKALDLTADQKNKLLEQEQALKRDTLPNQQKIQTLSLKLEEELSKDQTNRDQIQKLIREISQNRLEIQLKRTDFMLKFREMLTPDQKAKLKILVEKRREEFKKRFQKLRK
jgi:Spy/CpxP family protein refolding chaperone